MRDLSDPIRVSLVLPDSVSAGMLLAVRNPLETAGVLIASLVVCANGDIRVLGREMHWLNDDEYGSRKEDSLTIPASSYVRPLSRAEQIGAIAIWVHTHPASVGVPLPSARDANVDKEIADVFRLRTGQRYYGALILSPSGNGLCFSGSIEDETGHTHSMNRMWFVGDRFRDIPSFSNQDPELPSIFDRHIRAFGGVVQHTLRRLHVGVVGCGGIGSAVIEQLARLGIRRFTIIDPDTISGSNVTRVYGSYLEDVGSPKVDIAARNIERIGGGASCHKVVGKITDRRIASALDSCDVVFGCTDDNAGRLILSRLATYLLLPVIDSGVLLSSDSKTHELLGIDGRVTTVVPEQACLICRGRIDLQRAAAETLTESERSTRAKEGYAPALGNAEPAVVSYTTLVAATAVSELLERLIGYGPEPRPTEVLCRCHEREISTNVAEPQLRHYCHPLAGKVGLGTTTPFLDISWPG